MLDWSRDNALFSTLTCLIFAHIILSFECKNFLYILYYQASLLERQKQYFQINNTVKERIEEEELK